MTRPLNSAAESAKGVCDYNQDFNMLKQIYSWWKSKRIGEIECELLPGNVIRIYEWTGYRWEHQKDVTFQQFEVAVTFNFRKEKI